MGVAARVALVQVPWLTLEEESSPDLTNHIAGLETMLSEMQLRVRENQSNALLYNENVMDSSDLVALLHLNVAFYRCPLRFGLWRRLSRPGSKVAGRWTSQMTPWRI